MALSSCKKLSALFREMISNEDFYCLNSFHSSRIENKLKNRYNICKNHGHLLVFNNTLMKELMLY